MIGGFQAMAEAVSAALGMEGVLSTVETASYDPATRVSTPVPPQTHTVKCTWVSSIETTIGEGTPSETRVKVQRVSINAEGLIFEPKKGHQLVLNGTTYELGDVEARRVNDGVAYYVASLDMR
jgi:hypothetical protein